MPSWVEGSAPRASSGGRRHGDAGEADASSEATTSSPASRPRRGAASRRGRQRPATVRVLIVDDDRYYTTGLSSLLEADGTIDVVGRAHNGRIGIDMAAALDPDVILMDLHMPYVDGFEATREIAGSSRAEIIVLSANDSPRAARLARKLGASAVLHKSIDPHDLIGHVHEAAARRARRHLVSRSS